MSAEPDSGRGREFTDFIKAELEAERLRSERLTAKATRLQQAGGTVVALLAATVGLTDRSGQSTDAAAAVWFFAGAAVFSIISMVAGLVAERLLPYEIADDETYERMLTDRWHSDVESSRAAVSRARVSTITSLRKVNTKRVRPLEFGGYTQIAAVLVAGIGLVLYVL